MSNRYRNPFKIRATEKLEIENNFLRLFSPYVLEELIAKNQDNKLWNSILFIRSSPGAGKTSMLKVFDATSLWVLSNNISAPDYSDIIPYLKKLDVIDHNGAIHLLGVYTSCARNYQLIEDLELAEGQKQALFFALLNARIILSTLRSLITMYPGLELTDILVDTSNFDFTYLDIRFPISGTELFEWAAKIEKQVFKAIDSFLPLKEDLQGHHELFAFSLMQPGNISIGGNALKMKILFMFDDAHKFTTKQRNAFIDFITVKRADYNIWVAERLEALDEQRNFGSIKDRDYNELNLEEVWQGTSSKLKQIVASVAEKRAGMSSENVRSFQMYLSDHINESEYEVRFRNAFDQSYANIRLLAGFNNRFENWITYLDEKIQNDTYLNRALLARQIEILINRNIGKSQLAFEFPLAKEELAQKLDRDIYKMAEFLIYTEQKVPYYYSFDSLTKLSSNNIDQFLTFAGELFEHMLARKIADKPVIIDAAEQEKVMRKIALERWSEQIRIVPYSDQVMKFLSNFSLFAQKETNRPNAPYAPGINGFSIKEPAERKLIEGKPWRDDDVYKPLMNVLKTCLAYNLLERRVTKQGKPNTAVTVYYLNRWICVRYNLPLSYGGFRYRSPAELLKFTK
jgi:hypothetical protein